MNKLIGQFIFGSIALAFLVYFALGRLDQTSPFYANRPHIAAVTMIILFALAKVNAGV